MPLIAMTCFVVSWLLPIGALVVRLASPNVLVRALQVYGADLAWSVGLAVLGGLAAVAMGLGLVATGCAGWG